MEYIFHKVNNKYYKIKGGGIVVNSIIDGQTNFLARGLRLLRGCEFVLYLCNVR